MARPYHYINAAYRHGCNHAHVAFMSMCKQAATPSPPLPPDIQPSDAISLFKAYRLGYDSTALLPVRVLFHPLYGSLTRSQWEAQLTALSAAIIRWRRLLPE